MFGMEDLIPSTKSCQAIVSRRPSVPTFVTARGFVRVDRAEGAAPEAWIEAIESSSARARLVFEGRASIGLDPEIAALNGVEVVAMGHLIGDTLRANSVTRIATEDLEPRVETGRLEFGSPSRLINSDGETAVVVMLGMDPMPARKFLRELDGAWVRAVGLRRGDTLRCSEMAEAAEPASAPRRLRF